MGKQLAHVCLANLSICMDYKVDFINVKLVGTVLVKNENAKVVTFLSTRLLLQNSLQWI